VSGLPQNIENRLLQMKHRIEEAKKSKAQHEGSIKTLMKQLKTDHGCSSVKEAEDKLKALTVEQDKLESELQDGVNKLEEEFVW
jgi:predicted  nucleic acid-binding Zn-ribbon protein